MKVILLVKIMVVYESLISFLLPHEIYIIKILNIFAVKKKERACSDAINFKR